MVLNIFSKKSVAPAASLAPATPTRTITSSSPKEPTPKSKKASPRTSPQIGNSTTTDSNKGIAYKSTRIIIPGGSLSINQTPSPEEQRPQPCTTPRGQRKKRQSSPNTTTYKSKKSNSLDSINGDQRPSSSSSSSSSSATRIRNRERERAVSNRTRPLRGSYRDRRSSISSRESLNLRERKIKQTIKSNNNNNNNNRQQRRTPQPNPPYPINDIADLVSDEDHENDSLTTYISGQINSSGTATTAARNQMISTSTRPKRKNKKMELARRATARQLETPRSNATTSTTMEPSTSLQITNNTDNYYYDAPQPTQTEAVACILERTGSQARNSRRARRAMELRHQETIEEGSSNNHQSNNNSSTRDTNMRPISDIRLPLLLTPNINEHERHSTDINLQQHQLQVPNILETPIQQEEEEQQQQQPYNTPSIPHQQQDENQRPLSTLEETRNAILARLNARVDISMFSMDLIDPPPLDEYSPSLMETETTTEYSPPYREHLHRKVDLISFDPRYSVPVLRINKKLIKNKKNLKKVIRKLIKLRIVPEDVNLWEINKVDDGEFYSILPGLIHSFEEQQREERLQQRPEEYENDIQRALAISLEEENQRELYRGFRYQERSNNRVIEQIVQSPDFDLNHGRFMDASELERQEQPREEDESAIRRELLRGFRYNQSRMSRAAEEVIDSPVLEQIASQDDDEDDDELVTDELEENEDEFIDVDQAISELYTESHQSRQNGLLPAPRFGYSLPHHTQSSTSSFITARRGLSV